MGALPRPGVATQNTWAQPSASPTRPRTRFMLPRLEGFRSFACRPSPIVANVLPGFLKATFLSAASGAANLVCCLGPFLLTATHQGGRVFRQDPALLDQIVHRFFVLSKVGFAVRVAFCNGLAWVACLLTVGGSSGKWKVGRFKRD